MKHTVFRRSLAALICAVLTLSMFPITAASAAADGMEEKKVTAYRYNMDEEFSMTCLFKKDLPDVPFVDAADYLENIYTVSFEETKNDDGTYDVTGDNGAMTVDPKNDTVHFDSYEEFATNDIDLEGSVFDYDFARGDEDTIEGEVKPVDLDLSAYQIDIVEHDGKVYFPLTTIADLFAVTYNAAEYVDGKLYFVHTADDFEKDGYFDKSSLYSSTKRSQEMIEYTYNELCFVADHLYGMPSKAEIASSIEEKGLDKTLDEFSDDTRKAKELLMSDDLVDFFIGLIYLELPFDDGGHTVLFMDLTELENYPDTAFYDEWYERFFTSSDAYDKLYQVSNEMYDSNFDDVASLRDERYEAYTTVKSWENDVRYIEHGDTGVFVFDEFKEEVVESFKWSLDKAEEDGIENFVVDLSCNGGGDTAIMQYMMAIMTNDKNRTRKNTLKYTGMISGNVICETAEFDLNLDGDFDEEDDEVVYDFNYAVFATRYSFSCANLMSVVARDNGIPVLGENSGGGSCAITKHYFPGGYYYCISGMTKLISADGTDSDCGAGVDYELTKKTAGGTDYSGLYDIDAVSDDIVAFYEAQAEEEQEAAVRIDGLPIRAVLLIIAAILLQILIIEICLIVIFKRKRNSRRTDRI